MQFPKIEEYYGQIIATSRSGGPTVREARADYVRAVRQSLPYAAL